MANNDRLKQIVSNLQILNDLMNNMIDAEIYPVSFFSQAFDLIQKIQNNIHLLEADQVEMFATQMKKHQALILSIHQQMRNISPEKDIHLQHIPPTSKTEQTHPENLQPKTIKTIPADYQEQKKKTSLFSRLGISKADKKDASKKPATPVIKETKKIPDNKTISEKPAELLVAAPVTIVQKKTMESVAATDVKKQQTSSPKPTIPLQTSVSVPTNSSTPMPKATPIYTPIKTNVPPPEPVRTEILPPEPARTEILPPEPVRTEVPVAHIIPEPKVPHSLNEILEKKKLSDLRKAFSLNDRFLYRRELFGGNEEAMNKVITTLNSKISFKESITFLEDILHWDFSNPTVKNFVKILELRFL